MIPHVRWTSQADGDQAGDLSAGRPTWTWLQQVHGADVVDVTRPGEHAGAEADSAVTAVPGCVLAIRSADCAPVVLTAARAVGVLHVGWRGLVAGAVEKAVAALRAHDDGSVTAHLGPCIRVGCYEFDGPGLDLVAERYGPAVRGTTTSGMPALDLPGAVRAALSGSGVDDLRDTSGCTACDTRWYSLRGRGEVERIATLAWLEAG